MEQATLDMEKLGLVGLLLGAVGVLWRSYSGQIELNRTLTQQVTASTEVMRTFTSTLAEVKQAMQSIVSRLDHIEERFSKEP